MNEIRVKLALDGVAEVVNKVDTAAASFGKLARVGLVGIGLNTLGDFAKAAGAALFDASVRAERLRTSLEFATGGDGAREMSYISQVANRLGLELSGTARAYSGFANAARGTSIEGQKTRDVFEAVAQASAVMGLSADDTNGVLLALSQMVSKGTVQAEELRGQLGERLPGAFQIAARAMGVTTAELGKMLERGEVASSEFLPKFARQLREELGGAAEQASRRLEASTNRMGNAWERLKRTVGDAGVSKTIAGGADWLSNDMRAVSDAMDLAASRGGGSLKQLNDGVSMFIGRAVGLQVLSDEFLTLDDRVARLQARLAQMPTGGIYDRSERAVTAAELQGLQAVRRKQNGDEGAGGGRGSNAQLTEYNARMRQEEEERTARAARLAEVVQRLSGISDGYTKGVYALRDAYVAGDLPLARYVELVQQLSEKEGSGKQAIERSNAAIDLRMAQVKAATDALVSAEDARQVRVQSLHHQGLIAEQALARQENDIDVARLRAKAALIQQEIALERARPVSFSDPGAGPAKEAKLTDLQSQLAQTQGKLNSMPDQLAGRLGELAQQRVRQYDDLAQQAFQTSERLAEQTTGAMVALITDPLARARAEADLTVQQLDRTVQQMRDKLIDAVALAEMNGDDSQAKRLADRLNQITNAQPGAAQAIRGKAVGDQVRDFVGQSNQVDLSAGFDKAGQSMGQFVQQFSQLMLMQQRYNELVKAEGIGEAQLAALRGASSRLQISAYANMAGAAKGFFREGSTGYKVLSAAEKAFRLMELAGAVQNTAQKLGLLGTETAAKVAAVGTQAGAVAAGQATETGAVTAGEAARNAAKVPGVFMAFMSALGPWGMAAAGVAIAAVLGSRRSGGGFTATSSGTGTVLGDSSAQSESLKNTLERLRDVDTMTMRYSAQMAASLRSIEANIGGVTTLLIRSGNLTASSAGIANGYIKAEGLGNIIDKAFGIGLANSLLKSIPLIGNGLSNLATRDFNKLFGTSQSIVGQGLAASGQTIAQIVANGFQASYYADVQKKSKFLGMTTSTARDTQYVAADAELERQFGLIVTGFADTMRAAGEALGTPLQVIENTLAGFVVDIGRIDLQGLSGDQINEKLSAVFGALGDNMAKSVLGGLESFQQVGEGYLETTVRVATGVEEARIQLSRLGITMADFNTVTNKQADDLGAEFVRQSLLLKEGATGIADIVNALQGTAADIAATYTSLADTRVTLSLLGLQGGAVTSDLLAGAGSLDALTSSLSTFEDMALSTSEQVAVKAGRLTEQFARLGLSLPSTVADYSALVRGIDTSTSAGQQLLGQVLSLADGYSELAQAQKQMSESLASAGQGIVSFVNELRGVSGSNATMAQLRATFAADLTAAQVGDADASTRVVESARDLVNALKDRATDPIELARQTARIAGQLSQLPAVAAYQASQANAAAQAAVTAVTAAGSVSGVSGAPSAVMGAAGAGSPASVSVLQAELQAMREQLELMRAELRERGDATVSSTTRTARILENVTSDGNSIDVRLTT